MFMFGSLCELTYFHLKMWEITKIPNTNSWNIRELRSKDILKIRLILRNIAFLLFMQSYNGQFVKGIN